MVRAKSSSSMDLVTSMDLGMRWLYLQELYFG